MGIINFKPQNIGESGQIPSFIYIETTDTISTVTTAGYLNSTITTYGNALYETQIAVVTTKTSPSASPIANLYNVTFSGGNWTLTQIGGGGGGISGATNLGSGFGLYQGVSGSDLQFTSIEATMGGGINALPSFGDTTLSLTIDQSADFNPNFLGSFTFSGASLTVSTASLIFTSLPSATTSFALYYNDSTGAITQGTAGTGTISDGTSLGTGQSIFAGVSGISLDFNSIAVGAGITDSFASNTLTLAVDQSSAFNPDWLGNHSFTSTTFDVTTTGDIDIEGNAFDLVGATASFISCSATLTIGASTAFLFGEILAEVDSTAEVQLGGSTATSVFIGNSATTTLTIIGTLPTAIAGSVPVLWDPVSLQFSHT
jgi:hypothetical protein